MTVVYLNSQTTVVKICTNGLKLQNINDYYGRRHFTHFGQPLKDETVTVPLYAMLTGFW